MIDSKNSFTIQTLLQENACAMLLNFVSTKNSALVTKLIIESLLFPSTSCIFLSSGSLASSDRYETEKEKLMRNGISVGVSSSHPGRFYEEDKSSGYIRYNIKHYAINGLCYGQTIQGDDVVGKLVWMGRLALDSCTKTSVFVGLELVS